MADQRSVFVTAPHSRRRTRPHPPRGLAPPKSGTAPSAPYAALKDKGRDGDRPGVAVDDRIDPALLDAAPRSKVREITPWLQQRRHTGGHSARRGSSQYARRA